MVAGMAESSHLDPQARGKKRTLGMDTSFENSEPTSHPHFSIKTTPPNPSQTVTPMGWGRQVFKQ